MENPISEALKSGFHISCIRWFVLCGEKIWNDYRGLKQDHGKLPFSSTFSTRSPRTIM